jgi:hypothetical protein
MKHLVAKLALLFLSFTVGAAYVARSSDAVAGEKCSIAVKGASPTARACAKGGRDEARKVMKDMVTAAKTNGSKFSCDSCHKDIMTYELKPNAVDDYKKLQTASGMN